MSRRLIVLYPFLFAAIRVLSNAERNPGYYSLGDLSLILAVVLAGLGVIYALAAVAFRGRGRSIGEVPGDGIPALITFVVVLWVFWLFGFPMVNRHLPLVLRVVLAVAGIPAGLMLVRWATRRPRLLRPVATFLTLTGALVALRLVGGIAADQVRERHVVAQSALARELARPIPGPPMPPGPRRNVYLILLDEYANAPVLRDGLGFDNSAFLDSLRALGFYIPATGSNYAHTVLSLPSLLNAAHMTPVAGELPRGATDPTLVDHLLAQSRVPRFLQARGYRFVFFPSFWWESTRTSPIADSVVNVWRGFDLDRELSHTALRRVIRQFGPFGLLQSDSPADAEFVRRTLEGVGRLPSAEGPVFAFAHVLSPHPPYVVDRDCRPRSRYTADRNLRASYLGQLECLNGMVLATVNRLLRDAKVPPVILLQGDHGSAILGFKTAQTVEQVTQSAAWERLGAFGAYYLPDGGAAAFGDTVTVVNVLGNVLRRYFGADLPLEPDDRYLSVHSSIFRFRRVDPAWLAGGRTAQHHALVTDTDSP